MGIITLLKNNHAFDGQSITLRCLVQIVFIGPYEHHSNLLPWKEAGATVVLIRENKDGLVDVDHLRLELQVGRTP